MLTEGVDKTFQSDYSKHSKVTERLVASSLASCGQSLGRLGAPTEGRFSYSTGERRTEENVMLLRKAESDMDEYWTKVCTPVLKALEPVKKTAVHRFLTQPRSVQRTPAWVEPSRGKALSGPPLLYKLFAELSLTAATSQSK
jgi:hypothetical protein